MIKLFIAILAIIALTTTSCEKEEGFGGNSKIRGVIIDKVYDSDFSTLQYTKVAFDEDVFIQFGNDNINGENTSTSATGNFEFNYLNKGDYNIYYFSEDTTEANRGNEIAMSYNVNIDKRETLNMDTLYRYKFIDFNDGTAQISGKVLSVNYKKNTNFITIIDTTAAQNYDVFIIYNNHKYYDERERTIFDGSFTFRNLALGHYTIYTLSEHKDHEVEKLTIIKEVDITYQNQKVNLDTLYVKHED